MQKEIRKRFVSAEQTIIEEEGTKKDARVKQICAEGNNKVDVTT